IGMLQIRRHPDLGQEPLAAKDGAQLRAEDLERNVAVVAKIAGEVDGRHAAAADLALDLVAAREGQVELGGYGHSRPESTMRYMSRPVRRGPISILKTPRHRSLIRRGLLPSQSRDGAIDTVRDLNVRELIVVAHRTLQARKLRLE